MVAACAVASVPPRSVAPRSVAMPAAVIMLRIGCLPLVLVWIIGTKSLAVEPTPGGPVGKVSMRIAGPVNPGRRPDPGRAQATGRAPVQGED